MKHDTLLATIYSHHLYIECGGCGHGKSRAVEDLISTFGHGLCVADVKEKMRCSACGSREEPTVTITWSGKSGEALRGAAIRSKEDQPEGQGDETPARQDDND